MLLTTQYLEEADRLAKRIAVIDHGRVVAEGTAEELKARVAGETVELFFADAETLAAAVERVGGERRRRAAEPARARERRRRRAAAARDGR